MKAAFQEINAAKSSQGAVMRISSFLPISSLFTFVLLIADSSGCGGPAVAKGQVQASNRSQALQIGAVSKVSGIYENGKCMDPASGNSRSGATWSASSSTATVDEPTVVINNSTCALHITSLEVQDSGGYSDKLEGATPLSFTSQYAAVMPATVTVDGVEAPNYSLTIGSYQLFAASFH